jgi:hypothetical protein
VVKLKRVVVVRGRTFAWRHLTGRSCIGARMAPHTLSRVGRRDRQKRPRRRCRQVGSVESRRATYYVVASCWSAWLLHRLRVGQRVIRLRVGKVA